MVYLVYANWGEADGGGDFVTEDGSGSVSEVGIDQLTGNDTVTEESLSVGKVCVRLAGVGGGIEPDSQTQLKSLEGKYGRQVTSRLYSRQC